MCVVDNRSFGLGLQMVDRYTKYIQNFMRDWAQI